MQWDFRHGLPKPAGRRGCPHELLDVLLVDERREDEALQADHRLPIVGLPVAVGHRDVHAFAAPRPLVEIAEQPAVVVVVAQQLLARGGIGALAVLDRPGVHAVGVNPEDGDRAHAVVVEHRRGVVAFEVLAQRFRHLDEVAEQHAQAHLAEELQIGVGRQHPRAAARRLQGEHARMALAALEQVRHLLPAPDEKLHVAAVARQEQAGDVGREAGLVEVDADGVGPVQLRNAPPRRGQRAHGARAEAERVLLEVVVVEHRPGPADDRVGVDVRPVVEAVLLDQPVAQVGDGPQVVDPERVGRAHRRHQRHDAPPAVERLAGRPPPARRGGCHSPGGSAPPRRSSRRARASRRRSGGSSGSARTPG